MRMTHTHPLAHCSQVFLNGVPVPGVMAADEATGTVIVRRRVGKRKYRDEVAQGTVQIVTNLREAVRYALYAQ